MAGRHPAVAHFHHLAGRETAEALQQRALADGVVEGQQFARRLGVEVHRQQPSRNEGAGFGGEGQAGVVFQQVERLDAERIARQPGPAIAADQTEGIHAAQTLEGVRAFASVEMQQRLEVRAGGQLALQVEIAGQFQVIVDLAIADHRPASRVQRLPAALQVDDREPRVGQRGAGDLLQPHPVRSAMG